MVASIEIILYEAACAAASVPDQSPIKAGHAFEDLVSRAVFERLSASGITVYPPRYTLTAAPTVSGVRHEFDVVAHIGSLFLLVECKRRRIATLDQIFSFAGKTIDYVLAGLGSGIRYKAFFVSAGAQLSDRHRQYALGLGIIPISEDMAPPAVLAGSSEAGAPVEAARAEI